MSASALPAAAIAGAVAAARAQMRLAVGEDALLARLAGSAILVGEAFTGCLFVARDVEERIAAGEWRALVALPVRAIASVTDMEGVALAAEAHAVDIDGEGRGWVRAAVAARAGYSAGLAESWELLPAPLTQGVALLVAHLFEDRGGAAQPPAAVAALWRPWRRMRLGLEARP
ncbi:hypothetical protein [Sphingomonas sp.]|uniref:head-tail connector protein n=1 Tax=Sphingomonas sp. TaxID=28214 RepID=UPI0035C82B8E